MSSYKPLFEINNNIVKLISLIMEKIGKIHSYQSLDKLPRLRKQNRIRSIYSSCAIEANSLTLENVTDIINGKKVIGPEREIQEVKNAIRAYDKIEKLDPFSTEDLKKAHFIMSNYLVDNPGKFRNKAEGVFDGDVCIFMAPPQQFVPSLMEDLFLWLRNNKDTIHPLILSSVFHYEFVFIHPFEDGNGRCARLWQNAILGYYNPLFYWIPLENYIKDNQQEYYNAISKSHINGDSTEFIEFMLNMILKTINSIAEDIDKQNNAVTSYVKKLLDVMETDVPITSKEIMDKLGLKSKEAFRKNYLNPAMELNLVEFEIKNKPTSKNQRYIKILK